ILYQAVQLRARLREVCSVASLAPSPGPSPPSIWYLVPAPLKHELPSSSLSRARRSRHCRRRARKCSGAVL
uniref:Uncharacterized protein n=2 Tax=Aegilops tauschii subsp. strangulata TaxID=200361 RepID=A0A452XTF3_AEGTS